MNRRKIKETYVLMCKQLISTLANISRKRICWKGIEQLTKSIRSLKEIQKRGRRQGSPNSRSHNPDKTRGAGYLGQMLRRVTPQTQLTSDAWHHCTLAVFAVTSNSLIVSASVCYSLRIQTPELECQILDPK